MDKNLYNYKGAETKEAAVGIVKGIFGALPHFGTLLNEAFFDIRGRIKQNRINDFVFELGRVLEKHESEKINNEFIHSDEFIDIVESALSKASRTNHQDKIKLYARIIAGDIIDGEINNYDNELNFLSIIEQLSISELTVLKHLSPKKPRVKGIFFDFKEDPKVEKEREEYEKTHKFNYQSIHLDYQKDELFELKPNQTRIAIEGLIGKSLAYDDSPSRLDTEPRTYVGLTPLGIALFKFINEKTNANKG